MPNPKSGTVTENIKQAVHDVKHGQVRFKTEQAGVVQGTIANSSMDVDQIKANLDSFVEELKRLKPTSSNLYKQYISRQLWVQGIELTFLNIETSKTEVQSLISS